MIPKTIGMKVTKKENMKRVKNRLKNLGLKNTNIYILGRRIGIRKDERKASGEMRNEEMKISCVGNSFEKSS